MKEKLGFAMCFIGLLVLSGIAGAVTEFPPEATWVDWSILFGLAFTGGCLAQVGLWMIKRDI